ncbi:MAG: sigma-70 family RNA polymerase sigma factor [Clostridia bacterium]|nr:sigma-70 family RNA polymerase sigma factor [Clostridia bacterium]
MKYSEDALLARRAAKGDPAAFEEIVDKYQHMIYNLCLSKLRSREDALDVSQDTFLCAYRAISSFRGESKLSSWLYRICLNCIADRQRKKTPTVSIEKDEDGVGFEIPDTSESSDPQRSLEKSEKIRAVRQAIDALPDESRVIVVLREYENLSYQEISDMLGIEVGTVKSRLNRAREKIKNFLLNGNFIT